MSCDSKSLALFQFHAVLLFVAVSPIPLGGVRPFIVLLYRYRFIELSKLLSKYRTFSVRYIYILIERYIERFGTISNTNSTINSLTIWGGGSRIPYTAPRRLLREFMILIAATI